MSSPLVAEAETVSPMSSVVPGARVRGSVDGPTERVADGISVEIEGRFVDDADEFVRLVGTAGLDGYRGRRGRRVLNSTRLEPTSAP